MMIPPLWLMRNWKLVAAGALLVAATFSTWWVTRKVYRGQIAEIRLEQERAKLVAFSQGAALQEGIDKAVIRVGGRTAVAQENVVTRIVKIREEIPIYVKDDSTCITWGLVRVLDAAVHGVDPAALPLAPGESNETCADIGADTLADSIVANYGRAGENAVQLNGLIEAVDEISAELEKARAAARRR